MSTFKLPPPTVAGTTPPFYKTGLSDYILTVPFTMNKTVSIYEVGGVKLRIRAADTDLELGRITAFDSAMSASEGCYAKFDLSSIAASIQIGKYYKIQLAYIDVNDISTLGYYSTVSIVKCTSFPTVTIVGLDRYDSNVDIVQYTGLYNNANDPSEKCYQYKFTLYDTESNIIDTTGWKLHNSNTDDSSTQSTDQYIMNYACEPGDKYRLNYSVITTNNLQIDGPTYLIVGATSVAPELKADIVAELDYDNGCITLSLDPWILTKQQSAVTTYAGQFVITRTSSKENFKIWTKIMTFQLEGQLPKTYVCNDFTIEHGVTYRYALQQYNQNGIYSSKVYTEDIYAVFEDAFLYDGERQLRIRFNPRVSSFKTVIQDSKKNTLGSKYPFFFRNGTVAYKEFPISGLISYMIDENEYFLSKKNDLKMPSDWENTTDIIDDNIAYERRFKLEVLDWLNDGNIKLFRSPAEGNYLVRLMNINLTPNDSLSRMIHTFSCTADEIDSFSTNALITYGFLNVNEEATLTLRFGTINFDEYIETLIAQIRNDSVVTNDQATDDEVEQALNIFASTDLFQGCKGSYLKFEDCLPQLTTFSIDSKDYIIGSTGWYEHTFEDPIYIFKIKKPWRHMPGSVTFGVWTKTSTTFDTVDAIYQHDVFDVPSVWDGTSNYIERVETVKDKINRFYSMSFRLTDMVYEIDTWENFAEQYNLYLDRSAVKAYTVICGLNQKDYDNAVLKIERNLSYTREQKDKLIAQLDELREMTREWDEEHVSRIVYNRISDMKFETLLINNEGRNLSDIFYDGSIIEILSTGETYVFDKTTWSFIPQAVDAIITINYQDSTMRSSQPKQVELLPTQVCIDDAIIDLATTQRFDVPYSDYVPYQIYWGHLVSPVLIYQLVTVRYGVELQVNAGLGQEQSLRTLFTRYNDAYKIHCANELNFVRINKGAADLVRAIPDGDYDECAYFIWTEEKMRFERLSREQRANFTGNEVWIPQPYKSDFITTKEGISDGTAIVPYYQNSKTRYEEVDYEQAKEDFFDALNQELETQEKKLVLSDE